MLKTLAKMPQRGSWTFLVGFFGNSHSSEHTVDLDTQVNGNSKHGLQGGARKTCFVAIVKHHISITADSGGRPRSVCF